MTKDTTTTEDRVETAATDAAAVRLKDNTPAIVRGITENVEAIVVAFIMALLVRQFVLEVFKIPSDSMYPTLNGELTNGDRVVVNKARFLLGAPKRWDVTVFKYPLDIRRNFIKRLVGMSGERLSVVDGDIWVNREIERKPIGVQRSIWIERYPNPPKFGADPAHHPAFCGWKALSGKWKRDRGSFSVKIGRGEKASIAFDLGQPRTFRQDIERTYHEVRDYRFRAEMTTGDHGAITFEMKVRGVPFRVRLPIGRDNASVEFPRDGFAKVTAVEEAGAARHLPPGTAVDIEIAHWDWWFEVRIDGEVWFSYQTDPRPWSSSEAELFLMKRRDRRPVPARPGQGPTSVQNRRPIPKRFDHGPTAFQITTEDSSVAFEDVFVDQDLHYTYASDTGVDDLQIPDEFFFLMGDHSHGSRDSREWHRIQVKNPKTGELIWGEEYNWGLDSDRMFDQQRVNFVDLEGNGYWIPDFNRRVPSMGKAVIKYEPYGLIARRHLVGRAFCVFWPFPPFGPEFRPKLVR